MIPSPVYLIEEARLRQNLETIQQVAKSADIEIILALKGFAAWKLFPILREYINGAAASSLCESQLCVDEMKAPAHTYAVAYHPGEFDGIMKNSAHIVFNSLQQFKTYYPKIKSTGCRISCGLRVNPEWSDVKNELYDPSSPKSRLGVLHENIAGPLPSGIDGLHFHVLCESSSYALENTLKDFEERFGGHIPRLKWINMGGGHLMTRKGHDTDHLIKILREFKEKHHVHIILEPSGAFVWEAGDLCSRVLDIVDNRGLKTAVLDISFAAHMPDTLEMPYRPKIRGSRDPDEESDPGHLYRLGGISCLAGDFMEVYDFGKELQIGDQVIFEDMVHYTMVKTTTFNGVKHPAIALRRLDGSVELIREFGYEDYKKRLS